MAVRSAQSTMHGPIPASAGIGLRVEHRDDFLHGRPAVAWLEVHSENYFAPSGAAHDALLAIRADYPLSMHGVGLSLGSVDPLSLEHLRKLADAIERYEPALVSEHLSWGAFDGRHLNDLLPLPFTMESLTLCADRIDATQAFLGRRLLIENVSSYFRYRDSDIPEQEFMLELVRRTGCALLLDINNLFVNECNHGESARQFIDALPAAAIGELHLAGHSIQRYHGHEIVVDTHDAPVTDAVWRLYELAVRRFGRVPTLIEWDSSLPEIGVLIAEAQRAERTMEQYDAAAA